MKTVPVGVQLHESVTTQQSGQPTERGLVKNEDQLVTQYSLRQIPFGHGLKSETAKIARLLGSQPDKMRIPGDQRIDTSPHQGVADTLALRARVDGHCEDLRGTTGVPMHLHTTDEGTIGIFGEDEFGKIRPDLTQALLKQRRFGDVGPQEARDPFGILIGRVAERDGAAHREGTFMLHTATMLRARRGDSSFTASR